MRARNGAILDSVLCFSPTGGRESGFEPFSIYVRNSAGVERWECELGSQPCRQYLRRRTPAPLSLALRLPPGQYGLTFYNLDQQHVENCTVAADGVLDLSATDHDFGLVFKRH